MSIFYYDDTKIRQDFSRRLDRTSGRIGHLEDKIKELEDKIVNGEIAVDTVF